MNQALLPVIRSLPGLPLVLLLVLLISPVLADPPESDTQSRITLTGPGGPLLAFDPVWTDSGSFEYNLPLLCQNGPLPLPLILNYRTDNYPWLGLGAPANFWYPPAHFQHSLLPSLFQYALDAGEATEIAIETMRSGELLRFTKTGGQWAPSEPVPVPGVLKESEGFFYLLNPDTEDLLIFEKAGSLRRIAAYMDRNGNRWRYHYASPEAIRPVMVEDNLGRTLTFGFEGNCTPDQVNCPLIQVTDQGGRVVTYGTSGFVPFRVYDTVINPGGEITRFTYDGNGLLTGVQRPRENTPYHQAYAERALNGVEYIQRIVTQTDAYGHVTTFAYDAGANRVTATAPDETVQQYAHHANDGPPKSFTDGGGEAAAFEQTSLGQTSRITDREGGVTDYTYHLPTGRLATVTAALGGVTRYTYAAQEQELVNPVNGEPFSFTFFNRTRVDYPDGTFEQYAHDERGNVVQFTDAAGETWRYTYNAAGQMLTGTTPGGGEIRLTYHPDGTLASSARTGLGVSTFTYDPFMRLVRTDYPDGAFSEITYDLSDRVTAATDENGQITQYGYDANGNLTLVTDPSGFSTQYEYDLMDRLVRKIDPYNFTTQWEYDIQGRLVRITDATGAVLAYGYDPRGWLNRIVRDGDTWRIEYDREGVPVACVAPSGRTISFSSDALGYTTGLDDGVGHASSLQRDACGRPLAITDPLGRTVSFTYDVRGRLASVTRPLTGATQFENDALGLLSAITDPRGERWRFGYEGMGHPQSFTDPLGRVRASAYDPRGRVREITSPDGAKLTITYDGTGNVTGKSSSKGLALTFQYDAQNRLTGTEGLQLAYDAAGRIISTRDGVWTCGAAYDAAGRLQGVTYPGGLTVTYAYDVASGLLTGVSDSAGHAVTFTHDADQRLAGLERSNGVDTLLDRDAAGQLVRLRDGAFLDLRYSLDAAGQLTRLEQTVPLEGDPEAIQLTQWSYDAAAQIDAAGFAHDPLGRMTASPADALAWDDASRLTGVNGVSLARNGLGFLRMRTDPAGIRQFFYNFALAGAPVVTEVDGIAGTILRSWVWTPTGQLLYMVDHADGNKAYFYHFDRNGSTLAITDAAGEVAQAYAYDPYGRVIGQAGGLEQPFQFQGRYGTRREPAGECLYQTESRYYDAENGRFLSPDPLWPNGALAERSPYLFANANPVCFIDEAGRQADLGDDFWNAMARSVAPSPGRASSGAKVWSQIVQKPILEGNMWRIDYQRFGPKGGADTVRRLMFQSSQSTKTLLTVSETALKSAARVAGKANILALAAELYFSGMEGFWNLNTWVDKHLAGFSDSMERQLLASQAQLKAEADRQNAAVRERERLWVDQWERRWQEWEAAGYSRGQFDEMMRWIRLNVGGDGTRAFEEDYAYWLELARKRNGSQRETNAKIVRARTAMEVVRQLSAFALPW